MRPAWTLAMICLGTLVVSTGWLNAQQFRSPDTGTPPSQDEETASESLTLILRRLPPVIDDLPVRDGLERLPAPNDTITFALERLPGATEEPAWTSADLEPFFYPRTVEHDGPMGLRDEEPMERLPSVDR